jgi:hypothetical protein
VEFCTTKKMHETQLQIDDSPRHDVEEKKPDITVYAG